jgi:hypothetical protein
MSYLSYGSINPPSAFQSSFLDTYHNCLVCEIKNSLPVCTFQPKGTQTLVKTAVPLNNTLNYGYVLASTSSPGNYVWMTQVNVADSAILFVLFTEEFLVWIKGNSLLVNTPMVISYNNLETCYNYCSIVAKPNTTRSYFYCWTQLENTFAEVTGDIQQYWSSIGDIDCRLFVDAPAYYTDTFHTNIVALGNGTFSALPAITPIIGDVIASSALTELTGIDTYCFEVNDNNEPIGTYNNNTVFSASIAGASPGFGYFVRVTSTTYKLVSLQPNFSYLSKAFQDWLTLKRIQSMEINNRFFIVSGLDNNLNIVNILDAPIINTEDLGMYVNAHINTAVACYNPRPNWLTNDVLTGLYDAYHTIRPSSHAVPDLLTVVQPGGLNILYGHSLYDENLSTYTDAAIAQMQDELRIEQDIATQVATDENSAELAARTREFIDSKSTDINQKLMTLTAAKNQVQSLVATNAVAIAANNDLNTLVNSSAAIALNNNIFNLRNTVYDSLHFLHNRVTVGANTVYMINKVMI